MKKQEIKKLTKTELLKNIDKYKKDLFNFRFQKINSQVTNPSQIGQTKKTIARLKTVLKGKINV
ncbi:MAG: 50S ribosomal protein L29 [Pelagibacteraceae bacterium TMED267]|nr:MAG: 50S ribosomal protein L29 [Pelagibacteraceae bacterium TMED267]|tara:strand:- start:487 stop:678 length:192 start_codon:yes stop_codon:yes gene_type:complete